MDFSGLGCVTYVAVGINAGCPAFPVSFADDGVFQQFIMSDVSVLVLGILIGASLGSLIVRAFLGVVFDRVSR